MNCQIKVIKLAIRIFFGLMVIVLIGGYINYYVGPNSIGPTSRAALCEALSRNSKDDPKCSKYARLDDLLEETFPYGRTTRDEVFSILEPYFIETMTSSKYFPGWERDAYALGRNLSGYPSPIGIFVFDETGFLHHINFED